MIARSRPLLGFLLVLLVLLGLLVGSASADSLADLFASGNAAYARGDYSAAISDYETLVESGVMDAAVSYNLGNAHASLGHLGQAIRYFERTLGVSPGDDAAERNLKLARDALGERQAKERGEALVAERPALGQALFAALREDTLAYLLVVSTWIFSLALLALFFVRAEGGRLSLGISASVFALLALISGFGLWAKADFGAPGRRAIVVQDRAALREGPDDGARSAGELSEGESVRVLGKTGRFARVLLAKGGEGFVEAAAVGEI